MNAPLISEKLARFAIEKAAKDVPADVIRRAKYLFLDAIGIAFASTHFEFSKRAAMGLAGLGEGSSTVIGMPMTLPIRDAALLNGTLVHGLDFDDTYLPGSMHLSASAIPNSLAVASSVHASGRDMLIAAAIAMEVSARIAAGGKGWFQQAGFHTTGVAGIFGCALGTSRLWGMNLEQAITAQGIALSYASGSARPLQDGSWTKRIHPGIAASSAITATALARQGYVGPKETYEGVFGLYPSYLGEYGKLADYPLVTEKLGEVWEFTRATIKLFPACHQTHAFVNAAIKLHGEGKYKPEDITGIKALIAKQGVLMICEPLEVRKTPADSYSAQFSLPYQIARGLLAGKFGLTDLEGPMLKDADTLKLAKIMEYEIDPNAGFPKYRSGEVVLKLKDGRELRARENIMPDDPFSESDVERKFLSNASMVMSPARAAQVCDAILNLDRQEDVSRFAQLLGAPR